MDAGRRVVDVVGPDIVAVAAVVVHVHRILLISRGIRDLMRSL